MLWTFSLPFSLSSSLHRFRYCLSNCLDVSFLPWNNCYSFARVFFARVYRSHGAKRKKKKEKTDNFYMGSNYAHRAVTSKFEGRPIIKWRLKKWMLRSDWKFFFVLFTRLHGFRATSLFEISRRENRQNLQRYKFALRTNPTRMTQLAFPPPPPMLVFNSSIKK